MVANKATGGWYGLGMKPAAGAAGGDQPLAETFTAAGSIQGTRYNGILIQVEISRSGLVIGPANLIARIFRVPRLQIAWHEVDDVVPPRLGLRNIVSCAATFSGCTASGERFVLQINPRTLQCKRWGAAVDRFVPPALIKRESDVEPDGRHRG